MALITIDDLLDSLEDQQITVSLIIAQGFMSLTDDLEECFNKHGYTEAKQKLILLTLLGLLCMLSSDARITSQRAPNGASRSMKISDPGARWKSLTGLLGMLDPFGCTLGLIPPNPEAMPAGLWVSPGDQPGFCS